MLLYSLNRYNLKLAVWEAPVKISVNKFILELMNHGILHYLWSMDLLESFAQLIISIFTFSQYFFQ